MTERIVITVLTLDGKSWQDEAWYSDHRVEQLAAVNAPSKAAVLSGLVDALSDERNAG